MKSITLMSLLLVFTLVSGAPRAQADEATNQVKTLTLGECIQRALQSNLEIKSERINPTIGTWGVVGAQGVYDPTAAGSINYQDSVTPQDPWQPTLKEQQLQSSLSLAGKLPTGATYDLSAADTRLSGNVVTNFLFTGSAGVSLSQPLLKNFGLGVNAAAIRIARASRSIAIQNFVQLVMSKMSEVSTAYYELVYAIENHKAALETRELARQLLEENRQREKIGTMSRLDVIQAESGVASSDSCANRLAARAASTLFRLVST